MGRGGDWPPKSFAEWMIGQNFRHRQFSPIEGQKAVLKVELSEDEASGEETLAVTYPGRRRRSGAVKQAAAGTSGRKVRFDGDRKPLKSALKKSSSSGSSDTTLVDQFEEESALFTDDSSDIDTSEDDTPVRRSRGMSKEGKPNSCKKADSEDSSAAKDALPHPTCRCDDCVKGRKILKAVIKFEAKTKAAERAVENQVKSKSKGKQKVKKVKTTDSSDTGGNTTDTETTDAEKKPSPQGKKSKNQGRKQKTSAKETDSLPTAKPPRKVVNKDLFKMPEYPMEMKPNLIMRPEARVMQIEHAFETPHDPRPNAFYDNGKGITRVYHGPKYANPNGKLYANYDPGESTLPRTPAGLPVGAMPNPYIPWFPPGAPGPMLPFDPTPAMYAQLADNEEAMRKAAGQGFGLSGLPPPSVPPYFKGIQNEPAQQADWQKSGPEKETKRRSSGWSPPKDGDVWQKTSSDKGHRTGDTAWDAAPGWSKEDKSNNSNSKPLTPVASPDGPADPSQGQQESGRWGGRGDGNVAWEVMDSGSRKGSRKDSGVSPHNFGSWGDNQPEATFQRTSKHGGSQKHGSQKNGNGHNTWGANDDQNSGGWGGNDDKNNSDTTWGATGGNNGNGGGGGWSNEGNNGTAWGHSSNQAASLAAANCGKSGNVATWWHATSKKGGSPQQFSNDRRDTWGGPPGSFPRSAPNSRPGSNGGGNDRAWSKNGHQANGKGSEFQFHHSDPKKQFKGIFDWPAGSGPPAGFTDGGRGFRRDSKVGWQAQHPANPGFEAFWESQRGGADPSAGDFFFHSNSGPSDWTDKPSDQATGPSNHADWRNPDAAQNTGGKAMNW